jgi:hypothetical protein
VTEQLLDQLDIGLVVIDDEDLHVGKLAVQDSFPSRIAGIRSTSAEGSGMSFGSVLTGRSFGGQYTRRGLAHPDISLRARQHLTQPRVGCVL